MEKTHTYIEHTIKDKQPGEIIFPTDFRGHGTQDAIKKALSRLATEQLIKRIAHGIYYLPKVDPVLGELRPAPDDIIQKLADKDRIKIKPAGAYALHKLGLTTQVPTRLVYITDGASRKFKLGKLNVYFKSTTAKKLAMTGQFSSLIIQALEELGTEHINPTLEMKLKEFLVKENTDALKHDLSLAPAKINDYIIKLLKKQVNDRLVNAN